MHCVVKEKPKHFAQPQQSEKVQLAKAMEEAYLSEKQSEIARAEKERSTQLANIVVPAEISKQKSNNRGTSTSRKCS